MKRRTFILTTLAIFTFALAGCQQAPEATDATVQAQQENIENGSQSLQNQMQATAPSGNQIPGTQNQAAQNQAAQNQAAQSSDAQNPGTQDPGTQNQATQDPGTQNQATQTPGTQNSGIQGEISESRAKEIALTDAGITEADVLAILVKRDFDDGRIVYDVDFYSQNQEFDYEIDAITGAIISRDFEIENDFLYQSQIAGNGTAAGTISMEQATSIVLNRVSGATAQNVFMKLDYDDGYLKYEGEVYYNGIEYEFELNAQTGDVLEWSEERKGY